MEDMIKKKLPLLLSCIARLTEHIASISVPLSHRYVELELDPEVEITDVPDLLKCWYGWLSPCYAKIHVYVYAMMCVCARARL